MKEWFVFSHNGRELLRITVNGYVIGELRTTAELLAYENRIPVSEITVSVVSGVSK